MNRTNKNVCHNQMKIFSLLIDLLKYIMNENSFRLGNIETSVINKTGNSQENCFLLRQIIEEKFHKEDNESLNRKNLNLGGLLENQKNEN